MEHNNHVATVNSCKARIAKLKSENAKLRKALEDVMSGQLGGSPDMSAPRFQRARALLAKARA